MILWRIVLSGQNAADGYRWHLVRMHKINTNMREILLIAAFFCTQEYEHIEKGFCEKVSR